MAVHQRRTVRGTAELYEPTSSSFLRAAGTLAEARYGHSATLLNTGTSVSARSREVDRRCTFEFASNDLEHSRSVGQVENRAGVFTHCEPSSIATLGTPDQAWLMALYLRLFHGRSDSGNKLTAWGTDGPVIGPFDSLHVVYLSALRLLRDADDFELELATHQRFIVFDGVLYGDFELLNESHGQPMTLEEADALSNSMAKAPLKPLLEVLLDIVTEHRGAEVARRVRVTLEDTLTA